MFSWVKYLDDVALRSAVKNTVIDLIKLGDVALDKFAQLSSRVEFCPQFVPITELMTVLEWVNTILTFQSSRYESSLKNTRRLIYTQGGLVKKVVRVPGTVEKQKRQIQSVLRSTRTSIVKSLAHSNPKSIDFCTFYIDTLLTEITDEARLVSLGILAGASTDLFPSNPGIQNVLETKKPEIFHAYIDCILNSKLTFAAGLIETLNPFFSEFMIQEDFDNIISPAIAKSIKVLPEVVLDTIVPGLVKSMSKYIDPSFGLDSYMLEPLLENLESHSRISEMSLYTLCGFLANMQSYAIKLDQVVLTLLSRLETGASKEKLVQALSSVPASRIISRLIYMKTLSLISTTEPQGILRLLESLVSTFFKHFSYAMQNDMDIDQNTFGIILSGLQGEFCKVWIMGLVGSIIEAKTVSQTTEKLISFIIPELLNITAMDDTASIGFAIMCLAGKFGIEELLKVALSKYMSYSMFTRFTSEEAGDCEWAVRSIYELRSFVLTVDNDTVSSEWAQAWIFYIVAAEVPRNAQSLARTLLAEAYMEKPAAIGSVFSHNLFLLISGGTRDTQVPKSHFSKVISSMFAKIHGSAGSSSGGKVEEDKKVLEDIVSRLLVVVHHGEMHIKGGWVGLCQKVGVDYVRLVEERGVQLYEQQIMSIASDGAFSFQGKEKKNNKRGREFELLEACFSAAATLASVDSKVMVPVIEKTILQGLEERSKVFNIQERDALERFWPGAGAAAVAEEVIIQQQERRQHHHLDKQNEQNKQDKQNRPTKEEGVVAGDQALFLSFGLISALSKLKVTLPVNLD